MLSTRNTDLRQRGIESPFHDVVSDIPVARTLLKICENGDVKANFTLSPSMKTERGNNIVALFL